MRRLSLVLSILIALPVSHMKMVAQCVDVVERTCSCSGGRNLTVGICIGLGDIVASGL